MLVTKLLKFTNKIDYYKLIQSKPFWIMARALKDFVDNEGNGRLPVRGTLPDMVADTFKYISLQQL